MTVSEQPPRTDPAGSASPPPTLRPRRLSPLQWALKGWARVAVNVVYRDVEVDPAARRALTGPVVLVANHTNALGDPVVLLARLPGFPHFLAAATWWKSRPARWLFNLAGVIPVHRSRDGDTRSNTDSFASCHEALARGGTIALYPEGEMHNGPGLLPLRTGAARIALSAAAEANVGDVVILPVAVVYADKSRFRSRAAVNIGTPVPVAPWVQQYREDAPATTRALTDAIAAALGDIATLSESVDDAYVLGRAAALGVADLEPESRRFGREHSLARSLRDAVVGDKAAPSVRFRVLEAAVAAHDTDLARLHDTDVGRAVRLEHPAPDRRRRNRRELALLTPVAAVGVVVNSPVLVGTAAANRLARGSGWPATIKGVIGSGLSVLTWGAGAFWITRRIDRRAGLIGGLAGPLGGWGLLAWTARWQRERNERWHTRVERHQPEELAAARRSRATLKALVKDAVG